MKTSIKRFYVLWVGQLISTIGQGLSAFAMGVVAFDLSQKAMDSSLVMLFGFVPTVVLSLPAGVLADRYDRRLMMILGDGLSALGPIYILIMKLQGNLALIHILIGVSISAIFAALMQPAFQATVSDILDQQEYTKASGLVQLANSAKFLVSPILAGFLLEKYGLEAILIVDICTIFITVATTFYVRSGIVSKEIKDESKFFEGLKEGWRILKRNKGVFNLAFLASQLTFFIAFIESLSSPFFLSFTTSSVLGSTMTISAFGMLISSLFIGALGIKKNFVKILTLSLVAGGIFMMGFGMTNIILIITISGFLFFACLPFTNSTLDYLVRSNTKKEEQGRIWAFIGFISQMGFIVAYPLAGLLADKFFTPAMAEGGFLANTLGKVIGTGPGRGIGLEIICAGLFLILSALRLYRNEDVRMLEINALKGVNNELENSPE